MNELSSSEGESSGERLPRDQALRRSSDYVRCYRKGRRRHGSLVALHAVESPHDRFRLGLTVSRKVGKAVVRNRIKRRLREIVRRWRQRRRLPAMDLVLHVKPGAGAASFVELRREVLSLLSSLLERRRQTP